MDPSRIVPNKTVKGGCELQNGSETSLTEGEVAVGVLSALEDMELKSEKAEEWLTEKEATSTSCHGAQNRGHSC